MLSSYLSKSISSSDSESEYVESLESVSSALDRLCVLFRFDDLLLEFSVYNWVLLIFFLFDFLFLLDFLFDGFMLSRLVLRSCYILSF